MGVHFARVQLVCAGCGGTYATRQRGNTTKHRACGLSRYVPFGQPWEGPPPSNRAHRDPGVWLECGHCLTLWEARAQPRAVVRCPECKRSKRVPTDPVLIAPGSWDTAPDALLIKDAYAEQGGYRRVPRRKRNEDDPEGERNPRPMTADERAALERKHARTAERSGPAHAWREHVRQERREQIQRERERERERFGRPGGDSILVTLGRLLASQQAGSQSAQPAQQRQPPRSRPARPARPARQSAPVVPAGPVRMVYQPWAVNLPAVGHRQVAEYLRAIGAPLSETSGTRAGCQFHSLRSGLPCDQPEAVAVTVGPVRVGACADHARIAEQRMAAPRPRG